VCSDAFRSYTRLAYVEHAGDVCGDTYLQWTDSMTSRLPTSTVSHDLYYCSGTNSLSRVSWQRDRHGIPVVPLLLSLSAILLFSMLLALARPHGLESDAELASAPAPASKSESMSSICTAARRCVEGGGNRVAR
jgi:hypothetical protein